MACHETPTSRWTTPPSTSKEQGSARSGWRPPRRKRGTLRQAQQLCRMSSHLRTLQSTRANWRSSSLAVRPRALPEHPHQRDGLEQAKEHRIAAQGPAPLQDVHRQGPAMAVGRCHDGGFEIDPQVVPQQVWRIEVAVVRLAEEVLEPLRFRGVQESEDGALVLTEPPPARRGRGRCGPPVGTAARRARVQPTPLHRALVFTGRVVRRGQVDG